MSAPPALSWKQLSVLCFEVFIDPSMVGLVGRVLFVWYSLSVTLEEAHLMVLLIRVVLYLETFSKNCNGSLLHTVH